MRLGFYSYALRLTSRNIETQLMDSLADTDWISLPGTVSAADSTAAKSDDTSAGKFNRFYRVALIPP